MQVRQTCQNTDPRDGAAEGEWSYQPLEDSHDHLHIHPKSLRKSGQIPLLMSNFIQIIVCIFFECINNISSDVNMGDKSYFRNHESSCYSFMPYV